MFPLNSNDPYIDDTGKRSRLGDVIGSGGGGGGYTLPTASENTKGGIKVGESLKMTGEILNVKNEIPSPGPEDVGKVLSVGEGGSLAWTSVSGRENARIVTNFTHEMPVINAKEIN